jgi:hypothetical protein
MNFVEKPVVARNANSLPSLIEYSRETGSSHLSPAHRKSNHNDSDEGESWQSPKKYRVISEKPQLRSNLIKAIVLAFIVGTALRVEAQASPEPYPQMASIDEYLAKDRGVEISLARSAAPDTISRDATVLVFEKTGYETAVEGKNGFTCLVERAWMNPFDSPGFWNPKMRGPICYNPAAVRTILPYTINRTKLALTGLSKAQIRENITAAIAKNELPMPEAGAMSYMMSKAGNLGVGVGPWCPHLMFHVPRTDDASWGANQEGSPVVFNSQYQDVPEPETIFMVPVSHWSDGTAAPHHAFD